MDGEAAWPRAGMHAASLKSGYAPATMGRMDRELRMLRLELDLPQDFEALFVDHRSVKDDVDQLQAGSDEEVDYDSDSSWDYGTNPGPYLDETITDMIRKGDWLSLQPNSGQSVGIREYQVCVSFQENLGVSCRSWEWDGHALLSEGAEGPNSCYVYGNYLEPVYRSPAEICKVRR